MNSNYTNWFGDSAKEKLDSYKNKYYKGIQDKTFALNIEKKINICQGGIGENNQKDMFSNYKFSTNNHWVWR